MTRNDSLLLPYDSRGYTRGNLTPKPSHISIRGFPLARAFFWGSNTRLSHSKLIMESVYPDSEYVKYQPGVGYVVQLARWVEAGQTIIGFRYLPSQLIHS